jgi:hypothetical protein
MIQLLIFLLTTSDVSYIHDKNFDFSYNIFLILFDTPIMRLEVEQDPPRKVTLVARCAPCHGVKELLSESVRGSDPFSLSPSD